MLSNRLQMTQLLWDLQVQKLVLKLKDWRTKLTIFSLFVAWCFSMMYYSN